MQEIGWKVGGKQGEGIDSTGDIFAIALHRMGYYTFTYRHFMSLIKGGHTNYKIRAANQVLRHHGDFVSVLIAFDQTTIDVNWPEMVDGGVVLYDQSSFQAAAPSDRGVHLFGIPLTELAKGAGGAIMKNMVAIGATAAILQLQPDAFLPVVQDKFAKKGQDVVDSNMRALRAGYAYYAQHYDVSLPAPDLPKKTADHLYISGNQATGFGALAGGCRLLAAYPITPATEIMYWVIEHFPKHGGLVLQAEDEIAAINMAIGANFAGVRAMTSTSGPGFSLMMEALGLAGMSETPVVIVDVQRSGPSTGLPTKTEQSDLQEAVYGTHGEIERIVLTPRTVEECFYYTAEAFNLAERYQCPVIVLTDLYLGMSAQSVDGLPTERVTIERGKLISDDALAQMGRFAYQRYDASLADGVSPRALPGQKNARYVALGNEHNGVGLEVEDQQTRVDQVAKRARKLANFTHESGVSVDGRADAEFALVGFGSTWGVLEEARASLEVHGLIVKHIHFSRVAPFPASALEAALRGVQRALVVELNSTGQLAQLMQQHVNCHGVLANCLKYNGDPMSLKEILTRAHEVFPAGVLN
ncbi:2-oxoacid:acceptor oxidoreductase subunit alpha [Alicyclobacillus cycloheptanicus]|uniref:2-oxoglutarate ferredoxin oxidoreductase subunit alpha n=1 Tax=Alicyclobacillus cycloheptanicus TaxID=1457 RepID=A0ABT9XFD2_9BACL|nr:2-oxoacid:acceptor oxidoreductase subunit alpha [Alicyclobacillus cycloheptanicus]MDQ0189010.1 2-oxoglutarate ferredoxin oxidoreductase subunit alpha [Alicyclobacillus cycloheptanicus]WDM01650.1 2-oxoacid:acceptor oxidoreductase subunit alpha [Alicyclobacillus cycloheptanicus]